MGKAGCRTHGTLQEQQYVLSHWIDHAHSRVFLLSLQTRMKSFQQLQVDCKIVTFSFLLVYSSFFL